MMKAVMSHKAYLESLEHGEDPGKEKDPEDLGVLCLLFPLGDEKEPGKSREPLELKEPLELGSLNLEPTLFS